MLGTAPVGSRYVAEHRGVAAGRLLSLIAVAAIGNAGCDGLILAPNAAGLPGGPGNPHNPNNPSNPNNPNNPNNPGNDGGTPMAECRPNLDPTPVRRLRHLEYENAVRDLFPTLVLPAPALAADPPAGGYDNDVQELGSSPLLVGQYHEVSRAVATAAVARLNEVVPCRPSDGEVCSRAFIDQLGKKAFRRPLTDDERADFHSFFELPPGNGSFAIGAQLAIQAILMSPQFLYRLELPAGGAEPGELDGYQRASRLSFFLWSSLPDNALIEAAERGALATREGVEAEVRRMLDHPKSGAAFRDFMYQWSHRDRIDRIQKLPEDGFDDFRADLHAEEERFIDQVLYGPQGTLRDLFTSRTTFVNARLAQLYGVEAPAQPWSEVMLPPERGGGFLTRASFLAGYGHPHNPSPVLRGVFLLERVLCRDLGHPPPGAGMTPLPTENQGRRPTNREAYDLITGGDGCIGCHRVINPIGFAFEHFDTLGRFRTTDQEQPVDATGRLPDGTEFNGAVQLAHLLAESEGVARCVTRHRIRFAYGAGPESRDTCVEREVLTSFADSGYSLRELTVAIATHPRFFQGTPAR